VATESQTLRLGGDQTRAFIAGVAGVPVTGSPVLIDSSGQLGILASSARYKDDIEPMGARSQKVHHLRPVTFHYKQDPERARQYGLIDEEVAEAYPELVTRGTDGEIESMQYHELIPMLLNEVQHQQ
jgi:trimeric autotransporter adhesin